MNGEPTNPGWYYSKSGGPAGQPAGPFTWEQLLSLAQAGAIVPVDMVWSPSLPQWVPAADVAGLLPAPEPGIYSQPHPGQPPVGGKSGGLSWLPWALPLAALVIAGAALGIYFGLFHGKEGEDGVVVSATTRTTATATTQAPVTTAMQVTTTAAPPSTTTTAPNNSATWTRLDPAGTVPSAREGYAMAYNSLGKMLVLFGGWIYPGEGDASTVSGTSLNDTWAYDPAANTWIELKPAGAVPSPRHNMGIVQDPASGRLILFGGFYQEQVLGDTWAYDPATNAWTELQPTGAVPAARDGYCMAYDPSTKKVIIFGGGTPGGKLNDTWAYDPATNAWTELKPTGALPDVRSYAQMVFDPGAGKMILFGGRGTGGVNLDDTWAYDPVANSWTDLGLSLGPLGRSSYLMTYDSRSGKVLLYGGENSLNMGLDESWAYDSIANAWLKLTPTGTVPAAYSWASMAYDPVGNKAIFFGGWNGTADSAETWALEN